MSGEKRPFAANIIHFGFRPTATGLEAAVVSRRGVATILIGNDRHELDSELAEELAGAALVEDKALISKIPDAVARCFGDRTRDTEIHLDIRRNAAEVLGWAALHKISAGEMNSYGTVARAIGTGLTAQEGSPACAASRLAVLIPRHRAQKANGSISRYGWGVHKRKLLATERAA